MSLSTRPLLLAVMLPLGLALGGGIAVVADAATTTVTISVDCGGNSMNKCIGGNNTCLFKIDRTNAANVVTADVVIAMPKGVFTQDPFQEAYAGSYPYQYSADSLSAVQNAEVSYKCDGKEANASSLEELDAPYRCQQTITYRGVRIEDSAFGGFLTDLYLNKTKPSKIGGGLIAIAVIPKGKGAAKPVRRTFSYVSQNFGTPQCGYDNLTELQWALPNRGVHNIITVTHPGGTVVDLEVKLNACQTVSGKQIAVDVEDNGSNTTSVTCAVSTSGQSTKTQTITCKGVQIFDYPSSRIDSIAAHNGNRGSARFIFDSTLKDSCQDQGSGQDSILVTWKDDKVVQRFP